MSSQNDEDEDENGYEDNELSDEDMENEDYSPANYYQPSHNSSMCPSMAMSVNTSGSSGNANAKRLRTTILPEQQEYLMQKYQLDQNPSRKMLDEIAKEVRLKKRVVQVWFQNTRARERKGMLQRCVFALFGVHIQTRIQIVSKKMRNTNMSKNAYTKCI